VTAPRSPWQNPFVERLIGTLQRECLDYVIVWNERSLRRTLKLFLAYYHEWRPHLSLDKDAPITGGTTARLRHDRSSPARRRDPSPLRTPRRLTIAFRASRLGRHQNRFAQVTQSLPTAHGVLIRRPAAVQPLSERGSGSIPPSEVACRRSGRRRQRLKMPMELLVGTLVESVQAVSHIGSSDRGC
jgi:integrase-like protein